MGSYFVLPATNNILKCPRLGEPVQKGLSTLPAGWVKVSALVDLWLAVNVNGFT